MSAKGYPLSYLGSVLGPYEIYIFLVFSGLCRGVRVITNQKYVQTYPWQLEYGRQIHEVRSLEFGRGCAKASRLQASV